MTPVPVTGLLGNSQQVRRHSYLLLTVFFLLGVLVKATKSGLRHKVSLFAILETVILLTPPLFLTTVTASSLPEESGAAAKSKSPDPDLTKPSGCVAALEKYTRELSRQYHEEMQSDDDYERLVGARVSDRAADYAKRFSQEKLDGPEQMQLAQLYTEAGQWDNVRRAIRTRLEPERLTPTQRADILSEAVILVLNNSPAAGKMQAKTLAEEFERELEHMGEGVLTQMLAACGRLAITYGNDGDVQVKACAQRYIDSYPKLAQAERAKANDTLYFVYKSLADYYAGLGDYARAAETMRQGITALSGSPPSEDPNAWINAAKFDLGRYAQVGKKAQPIKAEYWVNGAPPKGELNLEGKVTVVEFTATWCVGCRESYPAMLALQQKYKDAGVDVVFATRLWGRVTGGDLTVKQEYKENKDYFVDKLHLPFKVAVAFLPPEKVNDFAVHDLNSANYFTQGIPQIVVVDRRGTVRDVIVGWDKNQATKLSRYVEKSLHENN